MVSKVPPDAADEYLDMLAEIQAAEPNLSDKEITKRLFRLGLERKTPLTPTQIDIECRRFNEGLDRELRKE